MLGTQHVSTTLQVVATLANANAACFGSARAADRKLAEYEAIVITAY